MLEFIESAKELSFSNVYLTILLWFFVALFAASIFTPIIKLTLSLITSKTKTDTDDKIYKIINAPIFWTLFILVFAALLEFFTPSFPLKTLLEKVVFSVIIILWVVPLTRISKLLLNILSHSKKSFIKPVTLPLFINISTVIIWSFAIYFFFLIWGISLTAWLASAGIVGIAVGFAAKDTLSNLIAGIFILADAPYKVGDIIVLDSGEKGEVIHVGLRSTRIKTYDGVEITIPNAQMGNSKIVNETGTHIDEKIRIKIPVGISYEDDIEKAEKIMLDIVKNFDEICKEPEPQVRFVSFGASSLDLELRFWVPSPRKRSLADKVMRRILEEFRKADIEIPYSKQDIYIKEFPKQ